MLISNTDDRLRNHGFLYAGPDGWRLALVYASIRANGHQTAGAEDGAASLDLALAVAEYSSRQPKTHVRSPVKWGWR